MAGGNGTVLDAAAPIDFRTAPERYRHWALAVEGDVATLTLDVDETAGLFPGYQLKLNSYDLGVDIELADALMRLRFEHPNVKAVVMRSGKERVFCAGANIRMLAGASHAHKVNFCKFTNETRNTIEDLSAHSGIGFVCAVNGTAAGGGYELALAADRILLADDGTSAVALPELPLLAVLPGTGGLTRVTDKRKVRRDRADVFCTIEEGIKGRRALDWGLVDELVPPSRLHERAAELAREMAARSPRPRAAAGEGVRLPPVARTLTADTLDYDCLRVAIDRSSRVATLTLHGPAEPAPDTLDTMLARGAGLWPLALARALDDAILHLRNNAFEIGTLVFKSAGDLEAVLAYDAFLEAHAEHWLAHAVRQYWKFVLKRLDVTAKTLVALIEPGSCFAGTLLEIPLACDRSYMLIGRMPGDNRPPAEVVLTQANFGPSPMCNGLTRLHSRFLAEPAAAERLRERTGERIDAEAADTLGLVTFALDDIDWEDEVRLFLEERASFSPDGLTGLEANLRFAGPETMESKIFARLTAWQNWIFQRPNAVGEAGALRRYGTGQRPEFDMRRV